MQRWTQTREAISNGALVYSFLKLTENDRWPIHSASTRMRIAPAMRVCLNLKGTLHLLSVRPDEEK
jgi:hypothetical protein